LTETLANGRYRIDRALGHGGMAVVYLAYDEELHRAVAVKVLAEHLASDDSFRARFLRESRLAGRLSHPNVVQVYDAGETEGSPYIVMEYVSGNTVAQRGKLSYAKAVPLALQACAGLQHAHNAGLVHRDVKPANLLVREDDVLKIADFGIARAAELTRLTQHGTVLGTAAYASPEQAAGEDVTAASDIYSLSAVLYELLTGRAPYQFGSLAELAAQQTSGVIAPLRDLEPSVPEPIEAAVMHALAREPRFRPASASAFAHELAAASEVPTRPLLATALTEPLEEPRKHLGVPGSSVWFWIAGAVAVATVAVILGLVGIGGGTGSPTTPQPVQINAPTRGATPAAEARNLSAWLRNRSR
jgi:serine/threonine protein kinase